MTEEQVTLALACTVAGVPENLIRTKMIEPSQWSDLYRVAAWLKTLPFIVHSDPKLTISALRAELRMWRSKLAKNGWWCEACGKRCPARLALVVADTVQVFAENEPTIDHDDGDFKKVGRVGRAMLKIAKDFDVSGVLISQIKDDGKAFFGKALKGHVQTEVHVKTQKKPSDLAVYKDKVSAQLVIEKQRHGPDTSVSVSFEKRLTRFVE
jgi:replicative DNA helicase